MNIVRKVLGFKQIAVLFLIAAILVVGVLVAGGYAGASEKAASVSTVATGSLKSDMAESTCTLSGEKTFSLASTGTGDVICLVNLAVVGEITVHSGKGSTVAITIKNSGTVPITVTKIVVETESELLTISGEDLKDLDGDGTPDVDSLTLGQGQVLTWKREVDSYPWIAGKLYRIYVSYVDNHKNSGLRVASTRALQEYSVASGSTPLACLAVVGEITVNPVKANTVTITVKNTGTAPMTVTKIVVETEGTPLTINCDLKIDPGQAETLSQAVNPGAWIAGKVYHVWIYYVDDQGISHVEVIIIEAH